MGLMSLSEVASSGYFKPAEHSGVAALLVEPTSVERDVPNEYQGVVTNRDEVTADISVFATAADAEAKRPSTVLRSVKVTHARLTPPASRAVAGAFIATVGQKPNEKGYVWLPVDAPVERAVTEYYEARPAEADPVTPAPASADGADDAPPF
ncbi:hypothetical protein [Salininema proteolyticum]|uniref:Uncharacterized protein n=1 Tax=Salininema proteolyticum TaxID=1607685 RepID=A0ABV8U0R3_9ACTN